MNQLEHIAGKGIFQISHGTVFFDFKPSAGDKRWIRRLAENLHGYPFATSDIEFPQECTHASVEIRFECRDEMIQGRV